jgi:hypothetical protein
VPRPLIRTVIESQSVSEKVDAERTYYPRLEDAFEALKWWLARKPETGILLDDYHWIFKQKGDAGLKVPALVIIYTFDAASVELISLLVRLPML